MIDSVSNNVSPRFEVKFNENSIDIRQEDKIDNFYYEDIASMSLEKGESNSLAMFLNFIGALLFEPGDISMKKDDQLQIKTSSNKLYNYSLRYLTTEKKQDLKKLINRFIR